MDNDNIHGNSGCDYISDGSGNDQVFGGSGNDKVQVGSGEDDYRGGSGFDIVDFVLSNNGVKVDLSKHKASGLRQDTLYGFEQVTGSNYADALKGSKYSDILAGGLGDGTIRGAGGADFLSGGSSQDTFLWRASDLNQQYQERAMDHINDFDSLDRLDLSDLNIGNGTTWSDVVNVHSNGSDAYISINLGGGWRDVARLTGSAGLSAADMLQDGTLLL